MEKIIERLKKKGVVDALQEAINEGPETPKEWQEDAIKMVLLLDLLADDALMRAFDKRAKEKALDEIVKKLNIQRKSKKASGSELKVSDPEFEAFIERLIR